MSSEENMEVIICFHVKDSEVLPWCVKGIKENINYSTISIISDESNKNYIENLGVRFVSEYEMLGSDRGVLEHHQCTQNEQWGWYFQQILKLAAADLVSTDNYLVVDADTVFLKRTRFFDELSRPLFSISKEYHKPYFWAFEKLLGFSANREYSFICHHMLFNKHLVKEMRGCFKGRKPWFLNVAELVSPQPPHYSSSQFSEYETYGHWVKANYPENMALRILSFENVPFHPSQILLDVLKRKYDFASFHHYGLVGRKVGFLKIFKSSLKVTYNYLFK